MEIIVALVLTVLAVVVVLRPFVYQGQLEGGELVDEAFRSLQDQRERCVQVLKDLELDFAMNKVGATEYQDLKAEMSLELAQVLEQLDKSGHA